MDSKAYIWDLDGTLIDSYPVIVSSLYDVCREMGIRFEYEEINKCVIQGSVKTFYALAAERFGIDIKLLDARNSVVSESRKDLIPIFDGAKETLERLKEQGGRHFIFTHRSGTAYPILDRLGIRKYFNEVVTIDMGFPRKPAPDAVNYILEKHGLSRENTYYVGDRTIDMDCARNAGIRGILFRPEGSLCEANGAETLTVKALTEICDIP